MLASQNHHLDLVIWVLGFVSGTGFQSRPHPLKHTDAEGIQAWMETYCAAHPLENIARAAEVLVGELQSQP